MLLTKTRKTPEGVIEMPRKWELADIFIEFGNAYRRAHPMPLAHHKVMHAVEGVQDIISGRPYESMQLLRIRASSI